MSYTVKDVYALQGTNRNVVIPDVFVKAIQNVHKSIEKSAGAGTSKQVEWRSKKVDGPKPHKKVFGSEDIIPQKYVSKFKKASTDIDDTILNTILRGKLNKFSVSNYGEIKEFITHIIDGGQTDMIKCFMKLVFEKAASEEIFCPLYAKLISELSNAYPILLSEMANLYSHYLQIFEHVADGQSEDYDGLCQRNIEKKYRRGYSQFLAELIKHDVVHIDFLTQIVDTILQKVEQHSQDSTAIKVIEEYADCLMKIIKAIQQHTSNRGIQSLRLYLKETKKTIIHELSGRNVAATGISNKARFTFLDAWDAINAF
jgi:hypothetical protein